MTNERTNADYVTGAGWTCTQCGVLVPWGASHGHGAPAAQPDEQLRLVREIRDLLATSTRSIDTIHRHDPPARSVTA